MMLEAGRETSQNSRSGVLRPLGYLVVPDIDSLGDTLAVPLPRETKQNLVRQGSPLLEAFRAFPLFQ